MDYSYPPEPGSVIVHNDAESWAAVKPEISANDAFQDGRAIKLMVAVGATIPEHYLSDGDNNNRATATQMGLPTFLKFMRRQQIVKNVLRTILDRVLREAQRVGKLSAHVDVTKAYDIIFPTFDHEDNQELGTAISYLMQGMSAAKTAGWISDETAMKVLFQFCGLEIDINEEKARILAQQQPGQQAAPLTTMLPDQQGANPDETEQAQEDPSLANKMAGNTPGGVGPGGW